MNKEKYSDPTAEQAIANVMRKEKKKNHCDWEKFKAEANEGGGLKVRDSIRFYVSYILPIIVLIIFALGIKDKFF